MAKVINTAEFRDKVEKSSGVAVVDFFATWCGPCKMLTPIFVEASEDMKDEAVFYKVDIDESLEIAQQFGISSVPTIMVFKDGKPVKTMIGFMPKAELVKKIKEAL